MTLFLTSAPGGYYKEGEKRLPCKLDERNGFVENLRKVWPENARVLFVSSDPDNPQRNDEQCMIYSKALEMTGFSAAKEDICDGRWPDRDPKDYDAVILGGGHVPTQNAFFEKIGLREKLKDFAGVVIGISAGTMNSAATVYAQPELEGEAVDPDFKRFIPGLGLTQYMIVPHYDKIREDVLDGMRVIEDITLSDSAGREIYLLPDGTYIMETADGAVLYGEAYLAADGKLTRICGDGETLLLKE